MPQSGWGFGFALLGSAVYFSFMVSVGRAWIFILVRLLLRNILLAMCTFSMACAGISQLKFSLSRDNGTVGARISHTQGNPEGQHILRGSLLAGVPARYQTLRSPSMSPIVSLE